MIRGAIIHHSGGLDSDPRASTRHHTAEDVNRWHKIRFGDDCLSSLSMWGGYTYYIDQFGKVTQFRQDEEQGCHCKGFNTGYIGICLAGNMDIEHPTDQEVESLKTLWKQLVKRYPQLLGNLRGHRNFTFGKSCPGTLISDNWIRMIDASAAENNGQETQVNTSHIKDTKLLQQTLNAIMILLASLKAEVERRANKRNNLGCK